MIGSMFVKSRPVLVRSALAQTMAMLVFVGSSPTVRADLSVMWSVSAPEQELMSWNGANLAKLKSISSQEKDPASGKLTHYKGVLLSQVLEKAMANLAV